MLTEKKEPLWDLLKWSLTTAFYFVINKYLRLVQILYRLISIVICVRCNVYSGCNEAFYEKETTKMIKSVAAKW
jgi:hypothetical protein